MTRQLTLFALLGLALLLTACQGGTRVIKDGFTARQVTEEDMRFLRSTRSWDTYCRWDQLVMEQSSGNWYCPPDASKDAFNTKVESVKIDPAKADAVISAAIHGLFFFGGMGLFGALAPETTVVQNGPTIRSSTTVLGGPIHPGVAP